MLALIGPQLLGSISSPTLHTSQAFEGRHLSSDFPALSLILETPSFVPPLLAKRTDMSGFSLHPMTRSKLGSGPDHAAVYVEDIDKLVNATWDTKDLMSGFAAWSRPEALAC